MLNAYSVLKMHNRKRKKEKQIKLKYHGKKQNLKVRLVVFAEANQSPA